MKNNPAKMSARELKISRIRAYLDELAAADELNESYVDDLLDLMQQYSRLVENVRNAKTA